MRFILTIFLFTVFIFGNQKITNPKTGEEVSLYNQSWAVIIGINKYEKTRELNYAVQDANSIRSMLISDYQFPESNIKMLADAHATKEAIRESIYDVIEKAGEDDQVLIFFAGHGETLDLPEGGEMGYLLPVDGDPDKLYLTALPMSDIKAIAGMTRARHVLFLVDACYGGLATIDARSLKPSTAGYLDKITRGKARQIITAGSRGEEVIEKSEWGHSAFTRNILRGLQNLMADYNNDGAVTADELGVYLKDKVTIDSEQLQTPQIRRFESGDGEFVFVSSVLKKSEPVKHTKVGEDEKFDQIMSKLERLEKQIQIKKDENSEFESGFNVEPSQTSPKSQEVRYSIGKEKGLDKSATINELLSLLESDTVEFFNKIDYSFIYGEDYIKNKYHLSLSGDWGYNRVDGFYLIPGIFWEPPNPNHIAGGAQVGYSMAAKRGQYWIDFDYNWIRTANFKLKTFVDTYDETFTYDYWRINNHDNSPYYFLFGEDHYDYFRNQGFAAGLTTEYLNQAKGIKSFYSIQFFQESHTPLRKTTDFSIINLTPARENINNPDSMAVTKITGVKFWMPGLNKTFNKNHKETFTFIPDINQYPSNVYLIAESSNWPGNQYKMEPVECDFEIKIQLPPGMYYYSYLVDSIRIIDTNNKNNHTFSNGDTLAVRKIGNSILPIYSVEFGTANNDSTFNYWTGHLGLIYKYIINPYNEVRFRIYSVGGPSPLPYTKYAYAGGMGSLRGYQHKEFRGDISRVINLEYEKVIYPHILKRFENFPQKIGLMVFVDNGRVSSHKHDDKSWDTLFQTPKINIIKTSLGLGINIEGLRLIAAKRMDRNTNDWSFVVEFNTFLGRDYGLPE